MNQAGDAVLERVSLEEPRPVLSQPALEVVCDPDVKLTGFAS
jgi:hypothetical protein